MDSIPLDGPKPAKCKVEGCGAIMHNVSDEAIRVLLRSHYRKAHPEEWRKVQEYLAGDELPAEMLRRGRFE